MKKAERNFLVSMSTILILGVSIVGYTILYQGSVFTVALGYFLIMSSILYTFFRALSE